MAVVQVLQVPV